MIMVHGDDNGMIMPPRLAPSHIVLLPIYRKEEDREAVIAYCQELADKLRAYSYHGRAIDVVLDTRDINAGEKGWNWIKKGIPLSIEVGGREVESNSVFVGRRDKGRKERYNQDKEEFVSGIVGLLDDIQSSLYQRAVAFRDQHTHEIDDWEEFKDFFTPKSKEKPELHGGFALSHWCESPECENTVTEELAVTIRCIPFDREENGAGKCIVCGKESVGRVVFAKAY